MKYLKNRLTPALVILLLSAAPCLAESTPDPNKAVQALMQHRPQNNPAPLRALETLVSKSYNNPKYCAQLEQAMIVLLKSNATPYAKHCICKQLVKIGSAACVPVLADLLLDPSAGESACYALRSNTSPQASEALRAALSKAKQPALSQIILAIGHRKDSSAIPYLIKLLKSEDEKVVRASMNALGHMADPRAAEALKRMKGGKYRIAATNGLLHCAQSLARANQRSLAVKLYRECIKSKEPRLARRSALLGLMQYDRTDGVKLALSIFEGKEVTLKSVVIANIHFLPMEQAAALLVKQLPNLNAKQQAELMDMLVKLRGEHMLPLIKRMASSKSIEIRLGVLKALGRIGDASSVSILIGALDGTPDETTLAKTSLLQMKARGADDELVKQLPEQNETIRIVLMKVLTDRESSIAVPELFRQAKSKNSKLVVAAYRSIRKLAGPEHLPKLLSSLQSCANDNIRSEIIKALTSVSHRRHCQGSLIARIETLWGASQTVDTRRSLLKIVGEFHVKRSFDLLKKALQNKDEAVKGVALRQLAQWPGVEALPVLKSVYTSDSDRTRRILALRAVIRLLELQNQLTMADTMRYYKDVLVSAKRPEEKKMMLSGLARLRTPQALDFVAPLLNEKGLRGEAQLAAVQIAVAVGVVNPAASRAVLAKVLAAPTSDELKNKAQAAMDEIEEFENFTIDTPAKPLFDGKTFTGWEGNLNAFRIADGAIVGGDLQKATPRNEYLCTIKTYGDFELRLKCKAVAADPGENATSIPLWAPDGGIQVRGRRTGGAGAMNGYEIDAGETTWGNIYDGNRGRVFVGLKPEELKKIVRKGQWNSYVIICKGPRLQIWVNGKRTLDHTESNKATPQTGLIGLQLAGGYPGQLWYKDITIKVAAAEQARSRLLAGVSEEVIAAAKARPLFDGKTFEGWEGNLKAFRVQDGAIVAGNLKRAIARNDYLCTKKEYTNFELRLKCKLLGNLNRANAGIQIRSQRVPNSNEMIGYQADMGDVLWGCLYDERRHKMLVQVPHAKLKKIVKTGQWNDYVIRCNGLRVQLWVNGHLTADYTEPDTTIPQTGVIGLQIHVGPPVEAWYKDIEIKELDPHPRASDARSRGIKFPIS